MKSLYGLLGESLSHSISPLIHSLIFKKLNFEGYYHLFEVDKNDLRKSIEGLKCLGAKGVNVTIPYKTDIIELLDSISNEAKRIGSVNAIQFSSDGTVGYNTDYFGLKRTFERYNIEIENKKAVLLGSGGVAITVVQLLLDSGIKDITIVGRNLDKIKSIERFRDLKACTYEDINDISGTDILINCTPSGMYPNINECLVPIDVIRSLGAVVDLIYNPKETLLLRNARSLGVKGVNGLYMLVGQAIEAQRIWNEIEVTYEFIDDIFDEVEKSCGWM